MIFAPPPGFFNIPKPTKSEPEVPELRCNRCNSSDIKNEHHYWEWSQDCKSSKAYKNAPWACMVKHYHYYCLGCKKNDWIT